MMIAIILLIFPGLPLGIDFTSGSTISYRWVDKNPTQEDIMFALNQAGFENSIVQSMGEKEFFIRTSDIGNSG
ncbi:uncharacterized protein METZ01_LOCUS288495, partial [marine metagenome]